MACNRVLRLKPYAIVPHPCADCGIGFCHEDRKQADVQPARPISGEAATAERERCADIFAAGAEQMACQMVAWGHLKLADVPERVANCRAEFVKLAELAAAKTLP